jgi:hypothetical protein
MMVSTPWYQHHGINTMASTPWHQHHGITVNGEHAGVWIHSGVAKVWFGVAKVWFVVAKVWFVDVCLCIVCLNQ